jgi:hypothetical protein
VDECKPPYTGAALLRLSAAAAKSKTDFVGGLKAVRPRDYLKEAVAGAISKKPPKMGALDYKAGPDKLCVPRHSRGSCVPRHMRAILSYDTAIQIRRRACVSMWSSTAVLMS